MAKRIVLIIIGLLFIISGALKAIDSIWFYILISNYGFGWAGYFAPLISSTEIILGICLILNILPKLTSIFVGLITFIFTIAFLYAYFFKGIEDCGCMGTFFKIPSYISFARNILIIMGCYWIWKTSEKDYKYVAIWKKWIVYIMAALSFGVSGYTLQKSIIDKNNIEVGEQANYSYLKYYNDIIAEGRSFVFIFSPNCRHCWNSTENVKSLKTIPEYKNVIGVTFADADTAEFMQTMKPNFNVYKYPTDELTDVIKEIPVLLVLDNGKVTKIFSVNNIPCGSILKKMEEEENSSHQ